MILIIDNGSQYTHLIMRNCRNLDFESTIVNNAADYDENVKPIEKKITHVILAGGPGSVYVGDNGLSEVVAKKVIEKELDVPMLGLCFGHQLIAYLLGSKVDKGKSAEYGISEIEIEEEDLLFKGLPRKFNAWVSHFDEVKELPEEYVQLAHSESCAIEAMKHKDRGIYGVQFHPEVWHTEHGEEILANFLKG